MPLVNNIINGGLYRLLVQYKSSIKTNRRTVLKQLGTTGTIASFGLATAEEVRGANGVNHVGVTYDTISTQMNGRVEASLSTGAEELRGTLHFEQSTMNINQSQIPIRLTAHESGRVAEAGNSHVSEFMANIATEEYTREGEPLSLKLTNVEDGLISGVAGHRTFHDDRFAFFLDRIDNQESRDQVITRLERRVRGLPDNRSPGKEGGEN